MKGLAIFALLLVPGAQEDGFTPLFNGKDLAGWKVPEGDGGHWKVVDGAIDYDCRSEAKGDKNLWTEKHFTDFVLKIDWKIKETPFTNPNVYDILPDAPTRRGPTARRSRWPSRTAIQGSSCAGRGPTR